MIDQDPMGDGLSLGGRLTFEGEPGFSVGPMVAAPALEGDERQHSISLSSTEAEIMAASLWPRKKLSFIARVSPKWDLT